MTDINRLKNDARRYEQREQWPLAIELYSKAIDASEAQGYGTDLSLYNRVGDLYLRQGDTARAVSFYERAVDRYAEQGLQTSAVALCNKVLRIAPGRSEIYRTLGRLHAETGLQPQARRSFMEYAARMEKAGDLNAAVEALDEFVKLSADEEARSSLGQYLIEQGRIPEGVTHLRQVVAQRGERGEESSELEALIEQVAPADSDDGSDDHVEADDPVEDSLEEADDPIELSLVEADDPIEDSLVEADDPVEDSLADPVGPTPVLTDDEAAELDQIIADLGDLVIDDEPPAGPTTLDVPATLDEPATLDDPATLDEPATLDDPATSAAPVPVEEPQLDVATLGASITVSDSTLHDLLNEFQEHVVATVEETDSAIHYDLGIAYREMGLLDDAIREFTTAIENDDRLLGAHQLLAESLIQKGQFDAGVGAMAEFVKAVGPENDVSGQMKRMNELLRASASDETLAELKQLLRSISDPDSAATEGSIAMVESVNGIDVDELFPDLEEAWEATTDERGPPLDGIETHEESWSEGSPDNDAEAIETEAALDAPTETVEEADLELGDAAAEVETEDAAAPLPEAGWEAEAEALEESGEPEALLEAVDEHENPVPELAAEDQPPLDEDGVALEALSEALGEPVESWSDPDEFETTWEPGHPSEDELADQADWERDASWEAELEAEASDEEQPEAELEAEASDEEQPEAELEAEASDEEQPEAELEAEVSDEQQPEAPPHVEDEDSGDLGGLLFGARLAKFRARMARSASETDFQAHYDLGLAYKEVALFDEAIAELLVAITGPDPLARKSLRLMSEVAHLAADESLHFTAAESLRERGMNAEALEHLSRVYDDRIASGDDTSDVHRRINAIDPLHIPTSGPEDTAAISAGFDSILDELRVVEGQSEAEAAEIEAAGGEALDQSEAPGEPADIAATEAPASSDDADENEPEDELHALELRAAELLEDGHRDEAIRELYRLQAAYESQQDFAGAGRAVGNLLLLDPEDVILHHQQVEYAIMLDDQTALLSAHAELGRCLQRQGAYSSARSAFEAVLEIDPGNALAEAAIAQIEQDDLDEEDAAPPPGDDPVHYETHYELGVAFKQDGLHDEAVYELEIAARGMDDPIPAYELLGELFNDAGQHETSSRVLSRALEANGQEDSALTGVLYQLGVSYQELGDVERAAEHFRRVFDVDKDYREVAQRLAQCSL